VKLHMDSSKIQRYRVWYAQLLRLYSKPYYERFGKSMEQTFTDVLRERVRSGNVFTHAAFLFVETFISILQDNIKMMTMNILVKRLSIWAIAIAALLMIPIIGKWPWTGSDFVFAIVVLFGSACAFEFIRRKAHSHAYRLGVGLAVFGTLLLVWINGAVGIIGDGDNASSYMYGVVILIGVLGFLISRFRPRGMSYAAFAAAVAQFMVPILMLVIHPDQLRLTPGLIGVFILNGFFAFVFASAGALLRRASLQKAE
jgi:hypothetical protein